MSLPVLRNKLAYLVIGGYLIFNYGFMNLRVPPNSGSGIPIGEIVLILFILNIHFPTTLPAMNRTMPMAPWLIWFAYSIVRAFTGLSMYGMWALRDATHQIESLYIIVGFAITQKYDSHEAFFIWLRNILIIACVYSAGYPVALKLQKLSPSILAGSGRYSPIFFNFTNTALLLILSSVYILLFQKRAGVRETIASIISLIIASYAMLLWQGRTAYIQLVAIFFIFIIFRRDMAVKSLFGITACLIFVALLPWLGLSIKGRLGQEVSISFLVNHVMAIGGVETIGLEGSARGVSQRLDWWTHILYDLVANWKNMLFGLGFGFPLVDFNVGVPVREPHNSYVSIVARTGLSGLMLFFVFHGFLIRTWNKAFVLCREKKWRDGENKLLVLMIYFILIWVLSFGEDGFEKPFNAIPYYFFWGVVIRLYYHLKNGNIRQIGAYNENTPDS